MSEGERAGPQLEMAQLLPEHRTITVGEVIGSLDFGARAGAERPYVVVNFVATADGRTAFQGRSGALSDPGDRAMFHGLRESVDAVLAGTNTMRDERYGRLVRDPERRERRAAAGLSPDPLAVVVTRTGNVPADIPLFDDPDSRVVVFTPQPLDLSKARAQVEVIEIDPGQFTLTTVLRRLRADYDISSLLCEGGATIFGSLLHDDLVDELFLTLAPKLTGGGDEPEITRGPTLPELVPLRLLWVLEREHSLFLRYAV